MVFSVRARNARGTCLFTGERGGRPKLCRASFLRRKKRGPASNDDDDSPVTGSLVNDGVTQSVVVVDVDRDDGGGSGGDQHRCSICNVQCRFCAPGERNTRFFSSSRRRLPLNETSVCE